MPILVLLVDWGIWVLVLLIVAASILSWFSLDPRNPFVKLLHGIVDPVLHPIQLIIPPMGGFDFSPLIAILILEFLRRILFSSIS